MDLSVLIVPIYVSDVPKLIVGLTNNVDLVPSFLIGFLKKETVEKLLILKDSIIQDIPNGLSNFILNVNLLKLEKLK
jgi:hypothetical protein